MTVLKQYPCTFFHRQFNRFFSDLSLPLTERQNGKTVFETHFFSQTGNLDTRISTRTEDEDEGSMASRIIIGLLEVEWWRIDILFSDFFADEGLERLRKLIRADDPGDNQLFKEGNLIPFAGPFLNEGISAIINLGPFSGHSFERFNETYKALNIFLQLTKCAPNFTGNPIKCLWNGLWGLDPCSSHRHEPHFR